MSFNKDRRGQRGRGKRDDFGNFDSFEPAPYGGDSYGGGNRGGGFGDRGGFGGGDRGGAPQRELTGEKATGTVKFFNGQKGFGFLTRDDGQPDAFVHISAVERSGLSGLNEGDRFEFDLEVDRRGKHSAVNLVPVSE